MKQPRIIKQLRFHEKYISIDWDTLKWAAKISIPYGIANVFFEPIDKEKYGTGMWFAISPTDITEFVFQKEDTLETGEIFLLTKDSKISLGTTSESDVAQKWVSTANRVVKGAKSKY